MFHNTTRGVLIFLLIKRFTLEAEWVYDYCIMSGRKTPLRQHYR